VGVLRIVAEPLRPESFEPFGQVLSAPRASGRAFFNEALQNTRESARVDLSIATLAPLDALPLQACVMERHPCSSQTFLPLAVSRYLVVVAPDAPGGGPDTGAARAFLADGSQGVTYRCGVWHHGMTVLDRPARMAVLMWCDGSAGDEEFLDLSAPFEVLLPAGEAGAGSGLA